ncbi:unnamed protein product [Owenia fusiformis]|uniref:Uncharacterized protein n=1 Tax=Owenia fusiformis TaxID=6347 RepID=A0A8J1UHH2_OWEFU|nr:unnamed protein product [Owenia fusiformis]
MNHSMVNLNISGANGTVIHMGDTVRYYGFIYILGICCICLCYNIHWLYFMYKVKTLHTRDNYFHIHLAVIHMIGTVKAMIMSPFYVQLEQRHLMEKTSITCMSIVLLSTIGAIRLWRLSHPYKQIPLKVVVIMSILPWVCLLFLTTIDGIVTHGFLMVRWPLICCSSVVMGAIYIRMIIVLYKKNTKIDIQPTHVSHGDILPRCDISHIFSVETEINKMQLPFRPLSSNSARKYTVRNRTELTKSKSRIQSDAHRALMREYKAMIKHNFIILWIFFLHVVLFSIKAWQHSRSNVTIDFIYFHVTLLTYNIMPVISFSKSKSLRNECRKLYSCCSN